MIGPDFLFTFKPGVYGRIRCGKIPGEIGTLEKGQAESKIALNLENYVAEIWSRSYNLFQLQVTFSSKRTLVAGLNRYLKY